MKPSCLGRVSVDTTVQPKAIAHPTDARLYLRALNVLVRQAKRQRIKLCQSHTRQAKKAAVKAGRYAHARQMKRMRREVKRLKTYLGRVYRDIGRNLRLVVNHLRAFFALILVALFRAERRTGSVYRPNLVQI